MRELLPTGTALRPRGRYQQFTRELAGLPLDFAPLVSVSAPTEALIYATGAAVERARQGLNVLLLTTTKDTPDVVTALEELHGLSPARDLKDVRPHGGVAVLNPTRFARQELLTPVNVLLVTQLLYPDPLGIRMRAPTGITRTLGLLEAAHLVAFTSHAMAARAQEALEHDARFHGLLEAPPADPGEDSSDHPFGPIADWTPGAPGASAPKAAFGTRTRALSELLGLALLYNAPPQVAVQAFERDFGAPPWYEALFAYPTLPSPEVQADWSEEFDKRATRWA